MLLNELLDKSYVPCSRTAAVEAAQQLFQEASPYSKVKLLDGSYKYVWNEMFLEKVVSTVSTGEYASFSENELLVLEEYFEYVRNGYVEGTTKDYILSLDTTLGELND